MSLAKSNTEYAKDVAQQRYESALEHRDDVKLEVSRYRAMFNWGILLAVAFPLFIGSAVFFQGWLSFVSVTSVIFAIVAPIASLILIIATMYGVEINNRPVRARLFAWQNELRIAERNITQAAQAYNAAQAKAEQEKENLSDNG